MSLPILLAVVPVVSYGLLGAILCDGGSIYRPSVEAGVQPNDILTSSCTAVDLLAAISPLALSFVCLVSIVGEGSSS